MPPEKPKPTDAAGELAKRSAEALLRERVVPRFVDSYVVENSRHALQVHASLYRDLLGLLQRETLLAATVCLIELVCAGPTTGKKPAPLTRKDAAVFRRKFLLALARRRNWNAGDALHFQNDL